MTDTDVTPSPEGVEKLNTLVALEKMRAALTNPRQGWMSGALWNDQDTPYAGGPVCLAGAGALAYGYGHLAEGQELDARLDAMPVMAALDTTRRVLYPDPNDGKDWFENMAPADRVAAFNDANGRTLTQVLALIDATIAKVGA